ncbi:MAG: hypothetical protein QXK49_04140, partial [Candidatus Aenigmatarchaeota archaeon]
RLVKVTPDGKLEVNANVSIDNVNIGDVNIRAFNNNNSPVNLGAFQNQDSSWSLKSYLTNDYIKTLIFGNNNNNNIPLSADQNGNLNVNIANSTDLIVSPKTIKHVTAPINTTNVFNVLLDFNCEIYRNKTILVKNVGANDALINVEASLDGIEYDIKLEYEKVLPANSQFLLNDSNVYMKIRISCRSRVLNNHTTVVGKYLLSSL